MGPNDKAVTHTWMITSVRTLCTCLFLLRVLQRIMVIIHIGLICGEDKIQAADSLRDDIGNSLPSFQSRDFADRFIDWCFLGRVMRLFSLNRIWRLSDWVKVNSDRFKQQITQAPLQWGHSCEIRLNLRVSEQGNCIKNGLFYLGQRNHFPNVRYIVRAIMRDEFFSTISAIAYHSYACPSFDTDYYKMVPVKGLTR